MIKRFGFTSSVCPCYSFFLSSCLFLSLSFSFSVFLSIAVLLSICLCLFVFLLSVFSQFFSGFLPTPFLSFLSYFICHFLSLYFSVLLLSFFLSVFQMYFLLSACGCLSFFLLFIWRNNKLNIH